MTEQVMGYLATFFIGVGGYGVVSMLIKKYVVPYYAKRISDVLVKALHPDTPDLKLNELLKAHALSGVRLAEYIIPDRGKGGDRFAMVDAYLAKFHIPEQIRKTLIEEAVYAMDDELKKASTGQ